MKKTLINYVKYIFAIATFCIVFSVAKPSHATTLEEMLKYTNENNETLQAERYNLKSVKMNKPKALGEGFLPSVSFDWDKGEGNFEQRGDNTSDYDYEIDKQTLSLTQPIFKSGQTFFNIKEAKSIITAQRETLRQTEQTVFYNAIIAFADILREQQLVEYAIRNEESLKQSYDYTQARKRVGDSTVTDVEIAKARYAKATSDTISEKNSLQSALATYENVVGMPADNLSLPEKIDMIVAGIDLDNEIDLEVVKQVLINKALILNPAIKKSKATYEANKNGLQANKTKMLPTVDFEASSSRYENYSTVTDSTSNAESSSFNINVHVPLFQKGQKYLNVKSKQYDVKKARYDLEASKKQVIENVSTAFDSFVAEQALLEALRKQVDASTVAVNAIVEEERLGLRSTIDVLNTKLDLYDAQKEMTTSYYKVFVSYVQLKTTVGELTADALGL